MFKKLAVLAATVAGAGALAVGGAAVASAAPLPVVNTTTHFSYLAGSHTLNTLDGYITPPNGTVVTFDLQAGIDSGTPTAHQLCDAVATAASVGATHVLNGPTGCGTVTPALPAHGHTLLALDVVNATQHTFQLANTPGGSALQVPAMLSPSSGTASVNWFRHVTPVNHAPYVYNGHRLTVSAHSATVGWSDSQFGWPTATNGVLGNHCVMVFIYGFDKPAGQAHIGFTCDNGNPAGNVGYLSDLAAGHSVSLFVQPAEGSYLNHHVIPGTSPKAHIDVVTPAV